MSLTNSIKQSGSGMAALYRRYAEWLVSITWKRFIVLSLLLLIVTGILSNLPPFNWDLATRTTHVPASRSVDITVDDNGVRIKPKRKGSQAPEITIDEHGVRIKREGDPASGKPPQEIIVDEHGVRRGPDATQTQPKPPTPPAAPSAKDEAAGVAEEITQELAQDIRREVIDAIGEMGDEERVVHVRLGNYLPQLAFLFILLSTAIKIAYAGRVKAEAKAAEAQEVAEAESLQRQVVEARMAAMQAQVEPHFLFNTLASIDHLIEVDPARASRMQKNLIALLRASMPAMRDKATNLGRELEVVRPYLEILKVRMEERLQPQVDVSEGLYSADFPPMMLQSLVENAIKHGLEPKADGGSLAVSAEVAHGKLHVSVADTGVGFARAATAGTGTGLTNIRERLKLIYGDAAELRIAPNAPTGTRVTIVVPYKAT
ncbi:MAG TPA: histidine kinase [Burkholderiales bacterium]|nr:histidine kinase [Burkholderiales bacterium]